MLPSTSQLNGGYRWLSINNNIKYKKIYGSKACNLSETGVKVIDRLLCGLNCSRINKNKYSLTFLMNTKWTAIIDQPKQNNRKKLVLYKTAQSAPFSHRFASFQCDLINYFLKNPEPTVFSVPNRVNFCIFFYISQMLTRLDKESVKSNII